MLENEGIDFFTCKDQEEFEIWWVRKNPNSDVIPNFEEFCNKRKEERIEPIVFKDEEEEEVFKALSMEKKKELVIDADFAEKNLPSIGVLYSM